MVPLPSYEIILGLDWLFQTKALIDFLERIVTVLKDDENVVLLHSVNKEFNVQTLSALQLVKAIRKITSYLLFNFTKKRM